MCNRQQQATEPAPPTKEIPRGPFTHTAHTRACMHTHVSKHTHTHTHTCIHNGSIANICFSPTRPRGLQGVAHRTADNLAAGRTAFRLAQQSSRHHRSLAVQAPLAELVVAFLIVRGWLDAGAFPSRVFIALHCAGVQVGSHSPRWTRAASPYGAARGTRSCCTARLVHLACCRRGGL
jgi:hypothetical protein